MNQLKIHQNNNLVREVEEKDDDDGDPAGKESGDESFALMLIYKVFEINCE